MSRPPTLTVWAVDSRSHDLASKSHGELENLKNCQTIPVLETALLKKKFFLMGEYCINLILH